MGEKAKILSKNSEDARSRLLFRVKDNDDYKDDSFDDSDIHHAEGWWHHIMEILGSCFGCVRPSDDH